MSMIQVAVTDYVQDPTHPAKLKLQTIMRLIQADTGPEALAVKDALKRLRTDQSSGTASPETLQADQAALKDALQALQARRRPAPVEGDPEPAAAPRPPRKPLAERPLSAQAQADFKSLASALERFEPVQRQTRLLDAAAKTGKLVNSEA